MIYTTYESSPVGRLLLAAKDGELIGLWIEGQKYYLGGLRDEAVRDDGAAPFAQARDWLKRYFRSQRPAISELPLAPVGSDFAKAVWGLLCEIPYGETTTYGTLAGQIAEGRGLVRMSAQAVGGAVAHNPVSIIIPCHRVVGAGGNLTGYAGGIDKKIWLMRHEGLDVSQYGVPARGAAL